MDLKKLHKEWSLNFDFDKAYQKILTEDFFDTLSDNRDFDKDDDILDDSLLGESDVDMFITIDLSKCIREINHITKRRQLIDNIKTIMTQTVYHTRDLINVCKDDNFEIENKVTRNRVKYIEINQYPLDIKDIKSLFDNIIKTESITIKIKCTINIFSQKDVAKFLCTFYNNFNEQCSIYNKKYSFNIENIKFIKNNKTASIRSTMIDMLNNDYNKQAVIPVIKDIFNVLEIKINDVDYDTDNLDSFKGSDKINITDEAKAFLYEMNIQLSNNKYTIEENIDDKTITIHLNNHSKLTLDKLVYNNDYQLIIKTKAKTELDAPSIEIKEPISNTETGTFIKSMLDYKDNILNTLTITFDNNRFDSIIYLNYINIHTVRYALINMNYNYAFSLDDYMYIKNNFESILFQNDKIN